ncbi:hypothetical protein [Pseudomonas laurylsulfatiphila]|uniref:hypothetical protein n=1 Tax=Pseudomonas laurylsulfatiphila TaxID=2011015 RepID=UPI003D1D614B
MKYLSFLIWLVFINAHATSFGLQGDAKIAVIDGKPAVCLPNDAKTFSVGWISLSESYVRNPGSWGVAIKEGFKPLELKPEECVVFGVVPDGYALSHYEVSGGPLNLEVNRTYIFRLSDVYSARDTYSAVFCIRRNSDGTLGYIQYSRSKGGVEVAPICDAKRNGNVPDYSMSDN